MNDIAEALKLVAKATSPDRVFMTQLEIHSLGEQFHLLHARVQQLEAERDQANAAVAVLLEKGQRSMWGDKGYAEFRDAMRNVASLATAFLTEHERLKANQRTPTDE